MSSDLLHASIHRDFAAARQGDKQAYGRLIQVTQRMVTGVALAHTRDLHLSQDIAQETFLRGWVKIADMSQAESFLPWLRQVARNQAIDHFRASKRREISLNPEDSRLDSHSDDDATPERFVLDTELSDWLHEAIDQVPDDTREVLMLYYMEGKSSQQVAALLGMSDANVRKRLQRARTALNAKFLQRFADAARTAAPGSGLASAVLLAINSAGSNVAKAAAAGTAVKAGGSLFSAVGALVAGLAATIVAVFVGVTLEIRSVLKKLQSTQRRRAMVVNGVLYAALMVGFILGLQWAKSLNWSSGETMAMSVAVSIVVVLLAAHRAWLIKRDRLDRE